MSADLNDKVSRNTRAALDVVLTKYATRTSVGILGGQVLYGFLPAAIWKAAPPYSGWPTCLAIGILLALTPLVFRKRVIEEKYQQQFDIIDEASARDGLSSAQRRLAYLAVIQKAIGTVDPAKDSAATIPKVRKKPVSDK